MRLIDADKLMKYLESIFNEHKAESSQDGRNDGPFVDGESSAMHNVFEAISEQPTVDTQPVVHAHWISEDNGKNVKIINGIPEGSCYCSNCEEWLVASDEYGENGTYCPNCGAKMDEVGK